MGQNSQNLERQCGILLHITSLPSRFGTGDLGPEAFKFVDFLAGASQKLWQILPLSPTIDVMGHSPYSSCSAHALNPLLISPEKIVQQGWLEESDLIDAPDHNNKANFKYAESYRNTLLMKAYENFIKANETNKFEDFCRKNEHWLDDFALFRSLEMSYPGLCWNEWPEAFAKRDEESLNKYREKHLDSLKLKKFVQFLVHTQWVELKAYANQKGIQMFGDLPLYVSYHSADVWGEKEAFKLDENGEMTHVAGVPPDCFCPEGQRWGNPVYDWEQLLKDDFAFWVKRLKRNFELFDLVRIDHFRGLAAYWEIPASEPTAMVGEWVDAPGDKLFQILKKEFDPFPVVAEDLGLIDEPVKALMKDHKLSGMKVLIFAFHHENDNNPYLPYNIGQDSIVYTGTHDNNTTLGWFLDDAGDYEIKLFSKYALDKDIQENDIDRKAMAPSVHLDLMRMALQTDAKRVIFPIQDLLGLGSEARFNIPGTAEGNWLWQLKPDQLQSEHQETLKQLCQNNHPKAKE